MATALQETISTRTTQNNSAIRVEDIRHSYGKRTALKGISFDVAAGEIFGLLGPNGSGKTTLFRILSTLMLPTSGRALVSGFDSTKQADEVRKTCGTRDISMDCAEQH
jgi:ABC-2 type transport system ATP-binding protein